MKAQKILKNYLRILSKDVVTKNASLQDVIDF